MSNKIAQTAELSYNTSADSLVIREAGSADRGVLRRVAERDSTRVPAGPMLVAELDGEIQAGISLADGRVIADPFRPTADLVALLELRAGHARRARGRGLRVVARSAQRLAEHRPAARGRLVEAADGCGVGRAA